MAKPDFRAAATVRLHAERSTGLSENVLRFLNGHDAAPRLPEQPSAAARPPERSSAEALRRGDVKPKTGDRASDETRLDPLAGLFSVRTWNRILRIEAKRFARYGRPVTLVVAQIDGLEAALTRLGRADADRLILSLAASMRRNARATDVLTRTGRARFAAMLPETDEIAAINYVERVRSECDAWLEAAALELRLAAGWAQVPAGGHLADALRLAEERADADRRRVDFRPGAPASAPGPDPDPDQG